MQFDGKTPTALRDDFADEFEIIELLIDRQLEKKGFKEQEGSHLMGDIVLAGWDTRRFVLFALHFLYDANVPKDGSYDKDKLLGRSVSQALCMAEFLKDNLDGEMQRILGQAHLFSVAKFHDGFSMAEARDFIEKKYRYVLQRGRPKKESLGKDDEAAILSAFNKVLDSSSTV